MDIDTKVTKKHFPRVNNDKVLEFIFERDPNLYLRKNKIAIRGKIQFKKTFCPENGLIPKLFSMMTVEIDSQVVSRNNTDGEFFLIDYLYKYGNYDAKYISSGFGFEGYFDVFNIDTATLNASTEIKANRQATQLEVENDSESCMYEFIFVPNVGFLASPGVLLNNCEIKILFDRAKALNSVIRLSGSDEIDEVHKIFDCEAYTEYVSSPELRTELSNVVNRPIIYEYDEIEVLIKNINTNETNPRFPNLRGGKLPTYMFVGILPQQCLDGVEDKSSTFFRSHNVKQMDFTLNGSSVSGYPIKMEQSSGIIPYFKFLDTTGQLCNNSSGSVLSAAEFEYNYLWSYKFEAEDSKTGWTGVSFELAEKYTEQMLLVCWFVYESAISIDKYHQVERIDY